jgi:hypothetical protein
VRNRFSALVKKGDLMLPDQRAQTQEDYTCLDDDISVKLFQSTNNDTVFVYGLCSCLAGGYAQCWPARLLRHFSCHFSLLTAYLVVL